jgi:23S rRNA (cytidine1920-2'-O)/16S rRNA (cytidine1409-2'-O)-methyltransferase
LRRLDLELTKRGLARSRSDAREMIEAGHVLVNGFVNVKATSQVDDNTSIVVDEPKIKYVSRGAAKLLSALSELDIAISEKICLDAGASTGGFVQVLLEHGADKVYAIDVGYGQLAWQLQQDDRVVVMDRTNVKNLTAADLPELVDLITADLSFISLKAVLPALTAIAKPESEMLLMVKPQFEVGKSDVGRGIVRSFALRQQAVLSVVAAAQELGWVVIGAVESKVHGPSGNREFFLHLARNGAELTPNQISQRLSEEF